MALVLGTGAAWNLSSAIWGTPESAADIPYPLLAQCLFAMVSGVGFAIVFNIHGPGGLLCALGGVLSWAVYCIALEMGCGDIAAFFWSGLFSSVYSEIMARIRKYPAISYLVVSIFPLIPGAGVYYTMNYAVLGNMEQFASQGMHTAAIAGIRNDEIVDVRGRGLMIGVEFSVPAAPYVAKLIENGVLAKETHERTIRFAPPVNIPEEELDEAIERIKTALTK